MIQPDSELLDLMCVFITAAKTTSRHRPMFICSAPQRYVHIPETTLVMIRIAAAIFLSFSTVGVS